LGVWVMWLLSALVLVLVRVQRKCRRWARGRKRVYRLLRRVRPAVRRMWTRMVLVFMAMLGRKRRMKTKMRMQRKIRSRIQRAV